MKRKLLVASVAGIFCAATAVPSYAQQSAASASSANNVGVGVGVGVNVNTGSSGATSSSTTGPVTTTTSATNGPLSATTGSSSAASGPLTATTGSATAINVFEAPKPQPPQAGIPGSAQLSSPTLFQLLPNNYGMPAEVTGLALELFYDERCQPEEGNGGESVVAKTKGESNLTDLTVTTHPDALRLRRSNRAPRVRTRFTPGSMKYRCLGMVTAMARKNAVEDGQPVGLSVLTSDIRRAVRTQFFGINGDVVVLSAPYYWGGGVGVTNGSRGASIGFSGVISSIASMATGGIAPGFAGGNGAASPSSRSGLTAMILVEVADSDPYGIAINIADVQDPFPRTPDPVGDNGKKAEVDKK
jgi:hypothetical protein